MLISYHLPVEDTYVFLGKLPIPEEKDGIPEYYLEDNILKLKIRHSGDEGTMEEKVSSLIKKVTEFDMKNTKESDMDCKILFNHNFLF